MFGPVFAVSRIHFVMILVALLSACQAARIPIPNDLIAGEPWAVKGRQRLKLRERTQSYSFALREDGAEKRLVKCETAHERGTVRRYRRAESIAPEL